MLGSFFTKCESDNWNWLPELYCNLCDGNLVSFSDKSSGSFYYTFGTPRKRFMEELSDDYEQFFVCVCSECEKEA